MSEIYVKTWRCSVCDFAFSGNEPTAGELKIHFDDLNLPDYGCPNCLTATMVRVLEDEKKSIATFNDARIDAKQLDEYKAEYMCELVSIDVIDKQL